MKTRVEAQLEEHSRRLTAGIVDTLQLQPAEERDVYTATVLELARQDQRIEGFPVKPIDAPALTDAASTQRRDAAWAAVRAEFQEQDGLLAKRRSYSDRLEAMGAKYEDERNSRIAAWSKWLTGGVLGLGGLVALCVFFPVAIPVAGRLLSWLAGKLPSLAGGIGVVSVKALDAVVRGIERAKEDGRGRAEGLGNESYPAAPTVPTGGENSRRRRMDPLLGLSLSRAMDAEHKALVRERKMAMELI